MTMITGMFMITARGRIGTVWHKRVTVTPSTSTDIRTDS